jgi:nucleoside-diphosphate-sugar epimerase
VTGGAGFIGKPSVELLIANGREVLVLDDLSVGREAHIPAGCAFRQLDLAVWSVAEAASLLCDFRPQAVVHLAAMHFIPDCMDNPERTFAVNVRATHTLVEALAHHPVEHLVFASTLDVYGTADVVHVEDEPAAPANVYGLSNAGVAGPELRSGSQTSTVPARLTRIWYRIRSSGCATVPPRSCGWVIWDRPGTSCSSRTSPR